MRYLPALAASLLIALTACSGIEIRPAATETFAAGQYRFYSWRSEPMTNPGNSADLIYALDPHVRRELDASLQAKGYVLDPERAQFTVDYLFAQRMRMGDRSTGGSDLSTQPSAVVNRTTDQASVDNAYALGGIKETNNIGIQFNDASSQTEVWRVVITKIVENVNATDTSDLDKSMAQAVKQATRSLPAASAL